MLHGGPGAPGSAVGLARLLGRSFHVLEPLQRRSGGAPLTVARHVEDLAEVAPPALVVGWSWGAMLGLSYAVAYPEKAIGLALVGCGTYSEADRALYRQRLDAALGPEGRRRRDELRAGAERAEDPATRDRLLAELGSLSTAVQTVAPLDDDDGPPLAVDAEGSRETWADALRRQEIGVEPAAFAAIRAPVLMIHGDDDAHPGPATFATLRPFLPQLEYVGLPRCGHTPWRERDAAAAFERALVAFLTRAQLTRS